MHAYREIILGVLIFCVYIVLKPLTTTETMKPPTTHQASELPATTEPLQTPTAVPASEQPTETPTVPASELPATTEPLQTPTAVPAFELPAETPTVPTSELPVTTEPLQTQATAVLASELPDPCLQSPCETYANCVRESSQSPNFICECLPPFVGSGSNCTGKIHSYKPIIVSYVLIILLRSSVLSS